MHHFLCTTDDVIGTASGDEYAPSMGYVSNCAVAPSVEIYLRAIIKTGKDSYEKITICAQKYSCFNESDFNKRRSRLRTKSQSQLTTTGKGARRESQRREYPEAGTKSRDRSGTPNTPRNNSPPKDRSDGKKDSSRKRQLSWADKGGDTDKSQAEDGQEADDEQDGESKLLCNGCGKTHGTTCSLGPDGVNHPDWNASKKPWAESDIGKQ